MTERNRNATIGSLMLLSGGIIGAGLALLYAPQSGKRTRRQIVRYSRKARNEAEETARDAANYVTEMVDTLSDQTSDLVDRGNDVASYWRKSLMESIENGQKALEKQAKRLSGMWG